jgi:hypothetical protein
MSKRTIESEPPPYLEGHNPTNGGLVQSQPTNLHDLLDAPAAGSPPPTAALATVEHTSALAALELEYDMSAPVESPIVGCTLKVGEPDVPPNLWLHHPGAAVVCEFLGFQEPFEPDPKTGEISRIAIFRWTGAATPDVVIDGITPGERCYNNNADILQKCAVLCKATEPNILFPDRPELPALNCPPVLMRIAYVRERPLGNKKTLQVFDVRLLRRRDA